MSKKSKKDREQDDADCGTKDISEALAELDCEWEDAEEQTFEEIKPDTYQVKIDKVFINKAKSSGRLQCNWEVTIQNGKYKGRKVWFRNGLNDAKAIGFFKGNLAPLGVEYPKKKPSKKLPGILEKLEGTYALVRIAQNGDFTNGYFQKALDSDDVDGDEEDCDCCCDCDDDCCDKPKAKASGGGGKKGGKKSKSDEDDDCCDCDCDCDDDCDCDCCDDKPKKKKSKKDDDCEDDEEEGVDLDSIDPKDLDKKATKRIKALAKEHDFDPDDYDNLVDLAGDVAEYLKLSGKYKKIGKLLDEMEAVKGGDDDCDDCDCDCD